MKLLIVGSRSITKFDLSAYINGEVDLIISGGANGIDKLAEAYADKKRISKLILRPNYKKYGKGAPLHRDDEMVDIADAVLAIWDGVSRGTRHTVEYAKSCGKPITVINPNADACSEG